MSANHLVPELLERIFALAHPQVDLLHTTKANGSSIWTLSYVSRTWRTVVVETKSLWTTLLLDFDPKALDSSGKRLPAPPPPFAGFRVSLALSRSGALPISIFICENSEYEQDSELVREPIFANSHRIRSYADQAWGAVDWLDLFDSAEFPQLQSLRLTAYGMPLGCRNLDLPALRSLHLSRFGLHLFHPSAEDILQTLSRIPWSQLTHLTMERAYLLFHPFSMTKSLLQQLKNLEHLTMKEEDSAPMDYLGWKIQEDEDGPHSFHASMKTLTLRGCQEFVLPLISTIRALSLTSLHIEVVPPPEWRDEDEDDDDGWLSDAEEEEEERPELRLQVFRKFFDHLEDKSSITNLGILGVESINRLCPVIGIVRPLQGLRTLSLGHLEPKLIAYLTWGSSPDQDCLPLPHLQSLALIIPNQNQYCDEIVEVIRSRLTESPASRQLRRIRLLCPNGCSEDILTRRFLPRLQPVIKNICDFSIETEAILL